MMRTGMHRIEKGISASAKNVYVNIITDGATQTRNIRTNGEKRTRINSEQPRQDTVARKDIGLTMRTKNVHRTLECTLRKGYFPTCLRTLRKCLMAIPVSILSATKGSGSTLRVRVSTVNIHAGGSPSTVTPPRIISSAWRSTTGKI